MSYSGKPFLPVLCADHQSFIAVLLMKAGPAFATPKTLLLLAAPLFFLVYFPSAVARARDF